MLSINVLTDPALQHKLGFWDSRAWRVSVIKADCGHYARHTYGTRGACTTAYGTWFSEGIIGTLCDTCCYAAELADMDAHDTITAYVGSGDSNRITTWKGKPLAMIVSYREYRTGFYGTKVARVIARDIHGNLWHGQGAGRGMCINLRRYKGHNRGRIA